MAYFSIMLVSYGLGCINGAYYVTKWRTGKDIRKMGTTNAGARNAGRVAGSCAFILTVVVDTLKVVIALKFAETINGQDLDWMMVSAICLLLGHIWPIQLMLHGGKGVVVYLAVTLLMLPSALIISALILLAGYLLTKRFTAPGLISLIAIPALSLVTKQPWSLTIGLSFMLLLVILTHSIDLKFSFKNNKK